MELYYLYFLIYSFLGWCMESTRFSLREKRFVNRGFLNGPLCPIYGIGMILIILVLKPFDDNLPLLFLFGMILASTLEFVTGFVLEKLFHTRWWDYSKKKFNINGYVCLYNSVAWGALCVIMIKVVQPIVENFINLFNVETIHYFVIISLIILIIDSIITLGNLLHLRSYISNLNIVQKATSNFSAVSERYHEIHDNLVNNKISVKEYLSELRNLNIEKIKKELDKAHRKSEKPRRQLKRLYRNYKTVSKSSDTLSGSMLAKKDLEK